MDTLKYEIADRASSLQKYDFFLQNMQGQTSIEALVKDFLKTKPSVKVFDIGCGDGGALRELKELFEKKVITCGIDLLQASGLDEFAQGDAVKKSFPKNCDVIVSFRALHEIANLQKVFSKISDCMSSGGLGFVSIRCQQEVGSKIVFHGNMKKTDLDFLKKIEKTGKFKKMRTLVIFVLQKTRAGKEIIAGTNVFLFKEKY